MSKSLSLAEETVFNLYVPLLFYWSFDRQAKVAQWADLFAMKNLDDYFVLSTLYFMVRLPTLLVMI